MSAFFFCGMIDEPVANASSSSTQPNSCDVQSTTSSPRRDRCTPISAVTKRNSATKSRSATASIELANDVRKPSSLATATGSSGRPEPASAPAPSGLIAARWSQSRSRSRSRSSGCTWASSQWPKVTGWACCRWVMPGRGRVDVPLGLLDQRLGQLDQPGGHAPGVVAQVEPQVGGDLVVAGPAGAQLAAEAAEPLQQAALQRGVHVLVVDGRAELPGGAGRLQVVQRGQDPAQLLRVEQAGAGEHPGVRPGAGDVVRGEPPVELHAHRQPGEGLGGAAGEPAAPQARPVGGGAVLGQALVVHADPLWWLTITRAAQPGVPGGGHLARQAPELHEALGQGLVEGVAGVVGGHAEVVQAGLGAPAGDDGPAAVQGEPHLAGDVPLGVVDERVERVLERREPQAVVDQLAPALVDAALEPGQVPLDGDRLQLLVGGDQRDRARAPRTPRGS